jgi:hypothetical protein
MIFELAGVGVSVLGLFQTTFQVAEIAAPRPLLPGGIATVQPAIVPQPRCVPVVALPVTIVLESRYVPARMHGNLYDPVGLAPPLSLTFTLGLPEGWLDIVTVFNESLNG